MSDIYANYHSVALSGTQDHKTGIETGIATASTIHQITCLANGTIIITPMAGPSFSWTATAGQSLNVVVKSTTVSSGTFIGFKAKFVFPQGRGTSAGWQY